MTEFIALIFDLAILHYMDKNIPWFHALSKFESTCFLLGLIACSMLAIIAGRLGDMKIIITRKEVTTDDKEKIIPDCGVRSRPPRDGA